MVTLSTSGSGCIYYCNTVADMIAIPAAIGDCVNVRGDVYKFNGGSWTLVWDDKAYREVVQPKREKAIYLDKPPFCFNEWNITRIDDALAIAWYELYSKAIVAADNLRGEAEVGDTIIAECGLRWKIVDREPNGDYVLERVEERINRPAPLGTERSN